MNSASDQELFAWLTEENNPAVAYRTKTEIMGEKADASDVRVWLRSKLPEKWSETKGLWYVYYLTAFAECGLSVHDLEEREIAPALERLRTGTDGSCETLMLLRSLVKLGMTDGEVQSALRVLAKSDCSDGGYLCARRLNKLDYVPKSCYKANLHALLLLAECRKKGIDVLPEDKIVAYFLDRGIFYRKDDGKTLVLEDKPGWRTVDTFYPFEPMRVGLQNVIEAFCALGYGNDPRLAEAWDFLTAQTDETGKVLLCGTLSKTYLPKEKVGKPGKWVTFYSELAKSERKDHDHDEGK